MEVLFPINGRRSLARFCSIINPSQSITKVTGLVTGVYQFQLKVTDNYGAISFDSVLVTVTSPIPQPPIANAGIDTVLYLPVNFIQLNGTGSFDPDGTVTGYNWRKVSGPAAYLFTDSLLATPSVTAMITGVYIFELTVSDNSSMTDLDSVAITVSNPPNQLPVANAGSNITVNYPGTSAQLNGNLSTDPDGFIVSYAWRKVAGPAPFVINNTAIAEPVINGLVPGNYVIELMVMDNEGATGLDSVMVTIGSPPNQPPVANAGNDAFRILPVNSIQLNGTNSADPDGSIIQYRWSKVAGPAPFFINNANSVNPTISNLVAGTYIMELTVTDNNQATGKDSVIITIYPPLNTVPLANAGPDQVISLPANSVILNGSASSDNNGANRFLSMATIKRPFHCSNQCSEVRPIRMLKTWWQVVYQFELKVIDDSTTADRDTVQVTVNTAPVVTQKFIKVNIYAEVHFPQLRDGITGTYTE